MQTETGSVPVGPDPGDISYTVEGELGDVVNELLEEGNKMNRMGIWAVAGAVD